MGVFRRFFLTTRLSCFVVVRKRYEIEIEIEISARDLGGKSSFELIQTNGRWLRKSDYAERVVNVATVYCMYKHVGGNFYGQS